MAITRTITVAAGVFGPGHLGELTQIVPFGLADAVLEEAGATERCLRLLPSRVGLYFVLGMVLFPGTGYRVPGTGYRVPGTGYRGVWAKLTDALEAARPDLKALRDLRRRIGAAPLKALFEVLAGPLAWPRAPGVMFGRYRAVAFDGCRSIRVPDSERNRGWLGKLKAALGETGYPAIQLMTLCETGTRALIGAVFGSPADGEATWARKLLHLLDDTMLVLMDRGFGGAGFLAGVAATKAQFLVRLTAARRPPVLRYCPDGSFLSVIGGVKVRIIPADVIVTCHDGTRYGDRHRLATTLPDWRAYPATALIRLYHERREHEITYLALRHTLLKGRVLRSGDPEGVKQEMRALLALYLALRIAVADAIATVPGTDPDRASYQIAVETAQLTVTSARGILPATPDLAGDIGRAVLATLHGPRRPRVCARKVKSPLSRWNKNPPGKPAANLRITALTTVITDYQDKPATRRRRSLNPATGP